MFIDENGSFLDQTGKLYINSAEGRAKENTGLNRLLGNVGNDSLYGGTGLNSCMATEVLTRCIAPTVRALKSMGGSVAGDEWKANAKDTGQVWYVGGTNADDTIAVDFVTEPGLLADHHLITGHEQQR